LCPPIPGAFSALGLVGSDLKRDYVRTVYVTTADADPLALEAAFAALEKEGAAMLARANVPAARRQFARAVDARYARQSYELSVPVSAGARDRARLRKSAAPSHARPRPPTGTDTRSARVQIASARAPAGGATPPLSVRDAPAASGRDAVKTRRPLWFRSNGEVDAIVLDRARMPA